MVHYFKGYLKVYNLYKKILWLVSQYTGKWCDYVFSAQVVVHHGLTSFTDQA